MSHNAARRTLGQPLFVSYAKKENKYLCTAGNRKLLGRRKPQTTAPHTDTHSQRRFDVVTLFMFNVHMVD